MLLQHPDEISFSPKNEIYLNQSFSVGGIEFFLIAITQEEKRNVLWAMIKMESPLSCKLSEIVDCNEEKNHPTNREALFNSISLGRSIPNIQEFCIQGQTIKFHSSSANCLVDEKGNISKNPHLGINNAHFLHFSKNGLDPTSWQNVRLGDIIFLACEQIPNTPFPTVDLTKDLNISVKIRRPPKLCLIEQPMRLEFGDMPNHTKYTFYDEENQRERAFFLNKMEHYDFSQKEQFIEEDVLEEIPDKTLHGDVCISNYNCPKDMDLAVLEYEVEGNMKHQLNFYTKEYLDAKRKEIGYTTHFLFNCSGQANHEGFQKRVCVIGTVPKNSNQPIDVELFSWYMVMPDVTISL